jgi:hypothetical protein
VRVEGRLAGLDLKGRADRRPSAGDQFLQERFRFRRTGDGESLPRRTLPDMRVARANFSQPISYFFAKPDQTVDMPSSSGNFAGTPG